MLSNKIRDILFGKIEKFDGGLPLIANLHYPKLSGAEKTIYWEGNLGLIITMWEKIETLEREVELLKSTKPTLKSR